MQSTGPTAKAPRADLDALAYGELQSRAQPTKQAERGFFSGRSFANDAAPAAIPSPTLASAEPAPRVIMAEAQPQPRPMRAAPAPGGGGLFAALGMGSKSAPGPLESNAQAPISNVVYAAPAMVSQDTDYKVDAGDKLRVVVFGQEGLTNSYAIDAGGGITMPLIGRVVARGMTPAGLAAHITARLRKGYIREPSVAVEIEAYRPFFILGEVAAPGQYPYVPNMSVEAAVAIAGGFSPRARRDSVMLTQRADGGRMRAAVPLGTPLSPGDTITVGERWF